MKKILTVLCGMLLILTQTGCAKKPEDAIDSGPTEKIERKKIIFYNLFDPEHAIQGQIQAYESSHKDIDIVYKKFHNVDEYKSLVLNQLAEGEGPDIFAIRNDWLPNYQKKLIPAPANIYVPEKYAEIFLGAAVDDLVAPDEEGFEYVWGIPLYIDTLALYYNKQLFRDNLPSTNSPASTWTEIKEQTFALNKPDNSFERYAISGMAMGHASNISHFADIFAMLLIQEGTNLFDEGSRRAVFAKSQGVSAGTGKPFFPAKEALELYTSFARPSSRHVSWNLPITGLSKEQKEVGAFARGKVAMMFGFSADYNEIKIAIDGLARANQKAIALEDIGVAPVPQFGTSAEEGRQDALAKYYPLVVSRNSQYANEAWEFLEYLSSAESLAEYHEKTKKPTSRLDMVEEQSTEKIFGVFARQAPYAKSLQTIDPDDFFAIFAKIIDDIVKSSISVDQGIQKAEKQMTCILTKRDKPELNEDCFSL